MNFLFTVAVLLVVLGVLIFVHELGHFLAAKWAGIRVHRFALGMGNPVPGLKFTRGNTEYAICWLPLGGYVKMASREEEATSSVLEGSSASAGVEPVRPDEFFEAKPVWKRMIVILAGVTLNVLFAWLAFTYLAAKNGEQIEPTTVIGRVTLDSLPPGAAGLAQLAPGDRLVRINGVEVGSWNDIERGLSTSEGDTLTLELADGRSISLGIHHAALGDRVRATLALQPYRPAVIGQVLPGRPAEKAGIAAGDTILSVNGDTVPQWYDLVERVRASAGTPLVLRIQRDSVRILTVTPEAEAEAVPGGGTVTVGKVGAGPDITVVSRPYPGFRALGAGFRATLAASTQIVRTVQGLVSARISSREVGGPILIGQMAAQTARLGFDVFLSFMALVSVNLAVLNLLPIPILDGGQFIFLLAEGVTRRPVPERIRNALMLVGMVLIVALMLLAFSNDIRRLIGW